LNNSVVFVIIALR